MDRFWIVLRDATTLHATMRHSTRESAMQEAVRLATANPGDRFYVAAVTGFAELPKPLPPQATWNEMKTGMEERLSYRATYPWRR